MVNNVVVRVEGSRYPGLVVQGDRLKEWLCLADEGGDDAIGLLAQELRLSVDELGRVARSRGVATD